MHLYSSFKFLNVMLAGYVCWVPAICFTKLYCRYWLGYLNVSGCRVFVLQSVSFYLLIKRSEILKLVPNASPFLNSAVLTRYSKETWYFKSPKPYPLMRLKPQSLLERQLGPTSQHLMVGTKSEHSVKLVLSRLTLNLDTAFSGHYLAEHDLKSTQEIHNFIISMWEVAMTKAVKSARDWFIAWNQVAAAITLYSHTKATNVSNTGSASSVSSLPYTKSTTTSFSVMTELWASRSCYDRTSYSQN